MKTLLLLALFFTITFTSLHELHPSETVLSDPDQMREVLYLPSGELLGGLSLGYRNFLADVIWLNAINYFGKHFKTDRNYLWLYHMCDLVTTLDPGAAHVYKFAANMLSWEANLPEKSILMLDKAVRNSPDNWEFYYLRGFTWLYFIKDYERAEADLKIAASKPEVPAMVGRIAAKVALNREDPQVVKQFLIDLIRNATDPNAKKALIARLQEIEKKGVLKLPEKILNR